MSFTMLKKSNYCDTLLHRFCRVIHILSLSIPRVCQSIHVVVITNLSTILGCYPVCFPTMLKSLTCPVPSPCRHSHPSAHSFTILFLFLFYFSQGGVFSALTTLIQHAGRRLRYQLLLLLLLLLPAPGLLPHHHRLRVTRERGSKDSKTQQPRPV